MAQALIRVPKQVRAGEPFEVRVLLSHPMESGQRRNERGELVPRMIVNRFACTLDGAEVFSAELFPAIAANPYFAFHAVAEKSGTLALAWTDDAGATGLETVAVTVA